MFIDTTPGTPPLYRLDTLTKLYTVGYDVENNVFFGSDCTTGRGYNAAWTSEWVERDRRILKGLGIPRAAIDKMLAGNARRFLGLSKERVSKRPLFVVPP
jgi:predicted TIM-barrel fold metal-dependent hydrolase